MAQSGVLLVDDDIDIVSIFKRALEREGYSVGAFSRSSDALDHFRANTSQYDLLLTDVRMQDMSGFELARRFREINPEIRLMFTSGFDITEEHLEEELKQLLPDHGESKSNGSPRKRSAIIVSKPARLERIIASVRDILSNYSSLVSPSENEHIVLLHSDELASYNEAISRYLNAGLEKGQLCVYTYTEGDVMTAMAGLSPLINEYKENVRKGNLAIIDFKPYCNSAIANNLAPFEQLMGVLKEKVRGRADQRVRIVGRAAGWLYENRYFEQCLALERWWHAKPFSGSLVCPYRMSLFEHKQFFEHQDPMFIKHDTILRV